MALPISLRLQELEIKGPCRYPFEKPKTASNSVRYIGDLSPVEESITGYRPSTFSDAGFPVIVGKMSTSAAIRPKERYSCSLKESRSQAGFDPRSGILPQKQLLLRIAV